MRFMNTKPEGHVNYTDVITKRFPSIIITLLNFKYYSIIIIKQIKSSR